MNEWLQKKIDTIEAQCEHELQRIELEIKAAQAAGKNTDDLEMRIFEAQADREVAIYELING
jgi:hypothetical protein